MVLELNGERAQELYDALLEALDWLQLQRLLWFRLDKDLEQIASKDAGQEQVVFMVVRRAKQDNWWQLLAAAALAEKPGSQKLQEFARRYLGPPGPDRAGASDRLVAKPHLLVQELQVDLDQVPKDAWWDIPDVEFPLKRLRSKLPSIREKLRSIPSYRASASPASVLWELRIREESQEAGTLLDDFEECVSHLLDTEPPPAAAAGQIRWFRRSSTNLLACLSRVEQLLSAGVADGSATDSDNPPGPAPLFKELLDRLKQARLTSSVTDLRAAFTKRDSEVRGCLEAVTEYLDQARNPPAENLEAIRRLLAEVRSSLDHAANPRQPPLTGGADWPAFPSGQARKAWTSCGEAIDSLEVYAVLSSERIAAAGAQPSGQSAAKALRALVACRRELTDTMTSLVRRIWLLADR
jgi:Effector-associated domain 1